MIGTRGHLRGLPVFDPSTAPDRPGMLFVDWLIAAVDAADRQRKHTRLRYTRTDSGWARELLWP
ncbi:hypothetical protein ACQPZX_13680 [Actinoplanes sp. CA-142083]|uniref:hypothetical protein n=1 Tax=Actinoplanes sp. CA-142083 TaxID=3239903 RepID=UPI003D90F318